MSAIKSFWAINYISVELKTKVLEVDCASIIGVDRQSQSPKH
jgi:hypothetical protein